MINHADWHVELLAPAGSFQTLRAAVSAGADAVYVGGTRFGARAYAENFDHEELLEAIDYAHLHGRKLYLTVNTLLRDDELTGLARYLGSYYERGLDAVIVQDVGVMKRVKEIFPELPLHVSTQATVTSVSGADYFKSIGASRIVPARELSLSEIRRIKQENGLEMECFVHGALCYSYSGQCLLSSLIGGRSGNRGQCAQPCRLPWRVDGGKQRDLMSLKDLETIDRIPELIEAGIDSFKIEGRMKQPDYVYTVVACYRKYIELYRQRGKAAFRVSDADRRRLEEVFLRRGYESGYYFRHNGREMLSLGRLASGKDQTFPIPEEDPKIAVKGSFLLEEESLARLRVWKEDTQAEAFGDLPQPAKNQPVTRERIRLQLQKTGNTPFVFSDLRLQVQDGLFYPMQTVSKLRREALGHLYEEILKPYRRTASLWEEQSEACSVWNTPEKNSPSGRERKPTDAGAAGAYFEDGQAPFSALVRTGEQLLAAYSHSDVGRVYVEASYAFSGEGRAALAKAKPRRTDSLCTPEKRTELFLAAPPLFREPEERDISENFSWICERFDGILARNLDTVFWLRQHGCGKPVYTDSRVYVWNQQSKAALLSLGVTRAFAPAELNARELARLDIHGMGLVVYTHQPVMTTANCIRRTTSGCRKKNGFDDTGKNDILYITDRLQKRFPVLNVCRYCYNVICNCEPTWLAGEARAIRRLSPGELRLDFLDENADQLRRILSDFREGLICGGQPKPPGRGYTKGHFRRGVK